LTLFLIFPLGTNKRGSKNLIIDESSDESSSSSSNSESDDSSEEINSEEGSQD